MPTDETTTHLQTARHRLVARDFYEQARAVRTGLDMSELLGRVDAENFRRSAARDRGTLALPPVDRLAIERTAHLAMEATRGTVSRDAFLASGGFCAPVARISETRWYDPLRPPPDLVRPPEPRPHPAVFSVPIRAALREIADEVIEVAWPGSRVLDPFAGSGLIHETLEDIVLQTVGVELEPEWAVTDRRTIVGDATHLPFADDHFDAVMTSPCYGNRMADTYDGRDGSERRTYRLSLNRMPTEGSAAIMQWGEAYRETHGRAFHEMQRVVRPGGFIVVNMSNHIRDGRIMPVVEWWVEMMADDNYIHEVRRIGTSRYGYGQNGQVRVGAEHVIVVRTPL